MKHVRQPIGDFLDTDPRARTGRGADCLSHARLDQLALGELPASEAAAARQHLGSCVACTAVADALEQDRRNFTASVDVGARAADALARANARGNSPAQASWWRRLWPVFAPAGLAAAGLFLVLAPKGEPSGRDETRTKGTFGLSVYVLHPEAAKPGADARGGLHLGEALHPGDQIRFGLRGIDAAGAAYVLGIARNGDVSLYHASSSPAALGASPPATAAGSPRAPGAGERLVPDAIELDGSLGSETLVALRCRGTVSAADVTAAAKQRGTQTSLGLACDEARYLIEKVAR